MPHNPDIPRLTFTSRAWLKFQFLCHAGPTEVGAFGLTDEDDPLLVEDLLVVKQITTRVTVAFDDAAVADLFDELADIGISPSRFGRIWLHTHPGSSVTPSAVDEETFDRVFRHCDWAVMGILGRTGRTSARLRFNAGPGGAMEIAASVDWSAWPAYSQSQGFLNDLDLWQTEFRQLVEPVTPMPDNALFSSSQTEPDAEGPFDWLYGVDLSYLTSHNHGFA
jgi:hypothetical protein